MALAIVCACFLIQFCLGLAAVVDTTMGVSTGSDHHSFTLQDLNVLLSEVQEKLHAIEKARDIFMSEESIERNSKKKTNTKQKRIRRQAAGYPQAIPDSQDPYDECTPGTIGCPTSVIPNSVGDYCTLCPAGPRGYPGPSGPPGRDGRDGRDSVAVISATGNLEGLSHDSYKPSIRESWSNTSGSVYVRWGHSECPRHSTLLYSGLAAGADWSSSGNGANQLCLPGDPDYLNPVAGAGTARSFLYSIEYQITSFSTLESRNSHDVSCAVCKAPSRFGQMMVPGKIACLSEDWTLEYSGYLMAERDHANHKRSMYICVDREMHSMERTLGHSSGGRLNFVEGRCSSSGGGLPCGPYIDGYEITCAVCTQ